MNRTSYAIFEVDLELSISKAMKWVTRYHESSTTRESRPTFAYKNDGLHSCRLDLPHKSHEYVQSMNPKTSNLPSVHVLR